MACSLRSRILCALALSLACPALGAASDRSGTYNLAGLAFVRIPASRYLRAYDLPGEPRTVSVSGFLLMTRPVTNQEFLAFVRTHPSYRRDNIARVFADERYLAHWATPEDLGTNARGSQPVTHVSWFAAKAFCEAGGHRLPTEAEWELVAAASATQRDARANPAFRRMLLDWYAAPSGELPDVPRSKPNLYGVRDLHGVIWEWVLDFGNATLIGDGRNPSAPGAGLFCGSGARGLGDAKDYAAFMRFAMRSSLRADYTTSSLGFRCAADVTRAEKAAR